MRWHSRKAGKVVSGRKVEVGERGEMARRKRWESSEVAR